MRHVPYRGARQGLTCSFGFELQGPCSAFTSLGAHIRDPKTFPLAAHNQELVLRHMTFALQQLSKSALNAASASTIASKDFFTAAGRSSASMFCHFNSSFAIVLLQPG